MDKFNKGTRSLGLYFDKDSPLHLEIRTEDPIIDSNSEEARLWYNKTEKVLKYTFLDDNGDIRINVVGKGDLSPELSDFIDKLANTEDESGSDLIGVKELSSDDTQITIPSGTLTDSLKSILNSISNIKTSNCVSYLFNKNEYTVTHNLNSIYLSVQVFAKKNTEINYKLIMADITILNSNQIKVSIIDDTINDSICSITKMTVMQ